MKDEVKSKRALATPARYREAVAGRSAVAHLVLVRAMRASRLRTFQKTLVVACVIAGVGFFLFLAQIGYYYYGTRPHEPHPEAGRFYVERVKGIGGVADVYLTRFEHLPFDYAPWIQSVSALFLLAALFLNQRWKVIHTSTYAPRKKFY